MTLIPRPYQIEGRDFLAARRFALLADEMRVGKTPQAILAAEQVEAERIVVVCPAIAVPQWQQEFYRWWPRVTDEFGPRPDILSYDKARMTIWDEHPHYDLAIVDECHFAKNPTAARTKAIFGKDGLGWHADRMWCLSGTPATRHAGELWPMLYAWGIVKLSYEQFCRGYCTYDWTKTKITGTRQDKIPEIRALLARIMLRRTRAQVAPEMPPIDFQFFAVDPVSHADLPAEYAVIAEDGDIPADEENRREVAIAKAPALVEEIAECFERGDYQQTVVFAWHLDAIQALVDGLKSRDISAAVLAGYTSTASRTRVQEAFRGGLKVLVCQIIAAGTAIDLSAASHGYFLELDWVPGNNMQAANRLVSMMKAEPVTFDICTWPGSVDDRVQRILLRRSQELRTMY